MPIPLWSVVTLCTELLVTAFVYYVIYEAYAQGVFHRTLAFGVLVYEALFNITYMASRLLHGTDTGTAQIHTPYQTALAIFHGSFSLLMFLALIAYFVVAARAYGRGEPYFRTHPKLMWTFLVAWTVSIVSGVVFFIELYLV